MFTPKNHTKFVFADEQKAYDKREELLIEARAFLHCYKETGDITNLGEAAEKLKKCMNYTWYRGEGLNDEVWTLFREINNEIKLVFEENRTQGWEVC